jgi:hypothetical protein
MEMNTSTKGRLPTFVIGCLYDGNDAIFGCIESIRNVYGRNVDIMVVDSNSPNTSYLHRIEDAWVWPKKNVNYTTGLVWTVYDELITDEYYFLHDNIRITGDIRLRPNEDVKTFGSWATCNWPHHRWDSPQQYRWVIDQLHEKTTLRYDGKPFRGVFGEMLFVRRPVLDRLKAVGFNRILPTEKWQSCGIERAWGMALKLLGYTYSAFYEFDGEEHLKYGGDSSKPLCKIEGTGNRQ